MNASEYLKEIEKYKQEIDEFKKEIEVLREEREKIKEEVKFRYEEIFNKMQNMLPVSQRINLVEMLRSINHDIRNHLLKLEFNLLTIKKESINNGGPNEGINKLNSSIEVVNSDINTITSLMNLYEPNSFQVSQSNLVDIAHNVSESFYNKGSKSEIKIEINVLNRNMPSLISSKAELAMIFYNLISNSHRAIAQKWYETGKLSISPRGLISISIDYSHSDQMYFLSIKDNGIGIKKEIANRIWEPGFTTSLEGLGLGLYFVKGVLEENYNGSISYFSSVNSGTTFKITMQNHIDSIPRS